MPGLVPLTERLEHAFAARAADLPADTQQLLVVVALNDSESLAEVLQAGQLVADEPVRVQALQVAADVALVELDERAVRFRHPLMRSAVRQSASVELRRRVHDALAETLRAEPDRRVWHRAALITGPHENISLELEEAGRRARRRGALHMAMTALRRAAEPGEPGQRGRRLLAAGELAVELGRPELAAPLLAEVDQQSPPLERALATWIEEMINPRNLGDGDRLTRIVSAAELARHRNPAAAAGDRRRGTPDTESARHLGPAALMLGAFDIAAGLLASAVDGAREEGRLGHLPRLLVLHSIIATLRGEWDVAVPAGEEARRLATELGQTFWIAGAETVLSLIAGMRGDPDAAEAGAARAEQLGRAAAGHVTVAIAQFGRVLSALGDSRHEDAYSTARRLFDPADPAYHPGTGRWILGDLAEAALHTDRVAEAGDLVAQVQASVSARPGVWIQLNLRYAHALLARDETEAQQRFDEALSADLQSWPFQRARLQLAYGECLRRRQIADSRAPLRAGRDTFDMLGCAAWSERARRELRASGERRRHRDPAARDQLTAQELQIAKRGAGSDAVGHGADIVLAVQGLLIDGPSAGQVVEAGDPPVRRAVVVPGEQGFGELAYRYYLESVEFDRATYRCAGQVEWPPEASSQMVRRLSDPRQPSVDAAGTGRHFSGY